MKISIGLEDFEKLGQNITNEKKWDIWYNHYYLNYKDIFDKILKYLLMCDVNDIKPIIEHFDFNNALNRANMFINDKGVEKIKKILEECEKIIPFQNEYTVYLLIGFGYVDGTSLPENHPFLYFGIDMYKNLHTLDYLVSHEYNHMVRINALDDNEFQNLTVKKLIIAEGLATLFPLTLMNKKINQYSIADVKMMSEKAAEYCCENEKELIKEILEIIDEPITPDIMAKYFISSSGWKDNGQPEKIGYYVGSRIIGDLINSNYSICELTSMPTDEVYNEWEKGNYNIK